MDKVKTMILTLCGKRKTSDSLITCTYCQEEKSRSSFPRSKIIPHGCISHLSNDNSMVCKACLSSALTAQLDMKGPNSMGCPTCFAPWTKSQIQKALAPRELGRKAKIRLKDFNMKFAASKKISKRYEPPEDEETLRTLIKQDSRLCPTCWFPFQWTFGCTSIRCVRCGKKFYYYWAAPLELVHERYLRSRGYGERRLLSARSMESLRDGM